MCAGVSVCVWGCMHVFGLYVHVHVCPYVCGDVLYVCGVYVHLYVGVNVHVWRCMYVQMWGCMYVHMWRCMYVCGDVYMCVEV
jgi:hypothetical protein